MPSNATHHETPEAATAVPGTLRVRLISMHAATPLDCEASHPVTVIGSRRDCHLPLNDPDVSKVHCAIVGTGSGFVVRDLCSRTGTFVNGELVRAKTLSTGDRLRVGPLEIVVEITGTPPPTTGPVAGPITIGGRTLELRDAVALIGRRSGCDLVVDTPDTSLAHALLFISAGRLAIYDLGSRSGTILNGERVQLGRVRSGDSVDIGGQQLVVTFGESASPVAPALLITPTAPTSPDLVMGTLDGPADAAAASPVGRSATEHLYRAALDELRARQQKLDALAVALDRRQAELDTLALLVALQTEHVAHMDESLTRRAAEADQKVEQARARLDLALQHEQALGTAWRELERWRTSLETRHVAVSPGPNVPLIGGSPHHLPASEALPRTSNV